MRVTGDPRPLIVHALYRFGIGGLENVIATLIDKLPWDAYRHAVVALTQITDFRERVHRPDVEYIGLEKAPGHAIYLYPTLFRYFRRETPTIVHTCNLAALETVVPAWFARVPVRVHAEHGWDANDPDGSRTRYRLVRNLYRPFVTHHVAVSRQLASYLTSAVGIDPGNVSLISNGVDTERFRPRADAAAIPSFPFTDDHWVVGTVGRMQDVKNQTLLARAFVRALQIEPAARATLRLAMVGSGPLRDVAAGILSDNGCHDLAWLPGEQGDIAGILQRLACFVLPSLTEGTSCTLQEAMSTSLPVVATAVGGNPDLIQHEVTGMLVPSEDPDAMARAILAYWRDRALAARCGTAARAHMVSCFALTNMVGAYDRLFSNLMQSVPQRSTECST